LVQKLSKKANQRQSFCYQRSHAGRLVGMHPMAKQRHKCWRVLFYVMSINTGTCEVHRSAFHTCLFPPSPVLQFAACCVFSAAFSDHAFLTVPRFQSPPYIQVQRQRSSRSRVRRHEVTTLLHVHPAPEHVTAAVMSPSSKRYPCRHA